MRTWSELAAQEEERKAAIARLNRDLVVHNIVSNLTPEEVRERTARAFGPKPPADSA